MLTPEEKALRRKAIGSSDVPAILGLGPRRDDGRLYRGPLDVWVTKDTASRPGLQVDDEPEGDLPPAAIGHMLERTLLDIYTRQTSILVEPGHTMRHATIPWAVATPDGLAKQFAIGCECKVVGARMLHEWSRDGVPAGVEAQCRWAMGVTDRGRWDVAVLLGGTEFRIYTLLRDREVERELFRQVGEFWRTHIEGDTEPLTEDPYEVQRYLRRRYAEAGGGLVHDDSEETALTARQLAEVKRRISALESEEKALENALCRTIGSSRGVHGCWGSFLWVPMRGPVRWKDVATANGAPPADLIEQYRGEPYRVPQLHLAKATASDARTPRRAA